MRQKLILLAMSALVFSRSLILPVPASFTHDNKFLKIKIVNNHKIAIKLNAFAKVTKPDLNILRNDRNKWLMTVKFKNLRYLIRDSQSIINTNNSIDELKFSNHNTQGDLQISFFANDKTIFSKINFMVQNGFLIITWPEIIDKPIIKSQTQSSKKLPSNVTKPTVAAKPYQNKLAVQPQANKVQFISKSNAAVSVEQKNQTKNAAVFSPINSSIDANTDLVGFFSVNSLNIIGANLNDYSFKIINPTHFQIVFNKKISLVANRFNCDLFKNINQINDHTIDVLTNNDSLDCKASLDNQTSTLRFEFNPKIKNIMPFLKPTQENNFVFSSPKVIVIDPGHGGRDYGASRLLTYEKELTLDIVNKLRIELKKHNISVITTRPSDRYISLQDRVDLTNYVKPDLFLSVHINSLPKDNPTCGIETYYCNDNSIELAKIVQKNLVSELNTDDRKIRKARFYVIKNTNVPAVLAEVGFITSLNERSKLASVNYQHQVSQALSKSIITFLINQQNSQDIAQAKNQVN